MEKEEDWAIVGKIATTCFPKTGLATKMILSLLIGVQKCVISRQYNLLRKINWMKTARKKPEAPYPNLPCQRTNLILKMARKQ